MAVMEYGEAHTHTHIFFLAVRGVPGRLLCQSGHSHSTYSDPCRAVTQSVTLLLVRPPNLISRLRRHWLHTHRPSQSPLDRLRCQALTRAPALRRVEVSFADYNALLHPFSQNTPPVSPIDGCSGGELCLCCVYIPRYLLALYPNVLYVSW